MATYRGRSVKLNKPFRTPNKSKKFGVYVRDRSSGNVRIVRFGDPNMKIKKNIPARQRSFLARMGGILKEVKGHSYQQEVVEYLWRLGLWVELIVS